MSEVKKVWEPTVNQCYRFVFAFCEVMGYNPKDAEFIGRIPDPFGIVQIGDDFWKMTDINYVLSEYNKWVGMYGEDLPKVIRDWVHYCDGIYDQNLQIEQQRDWQTDDKVPPVKDEESIYSDVVAIIKYGTGEVDLGRYNNALKRWYTYPKGRFARVTAWKSLAFPDKLPTHPTNLHHWLLGWRPDGLSSEDYRKMREKELELAMKRVERLKAELNKTVEEHF